MQHNVLIDALGETRLCAHLSQSEIVQLIELGRVREAELGGRLDESPGELLVLLGGEAEIVREAPDGGYPWVTTACTGAVLNELAFLAGVETHETVRASTAVRVFVLTRSTFARLIMDGVPLASKLGLNLARAVAARLDDRNTAVVNLVRQHEELLESMDRLLTNPQVQAQVFGKSVPAAAPSNEFDAFKEELAKNWDP